MLSSLKPLTTNENLPDPSLEGINFRGPFICIRPLTIEHKTEGGILIPEEAQESFRQTMCLARVLAVSPNAYDPEIQGPVPLEVGDYVMFDKIAAERRLDVQGVEVIVINADKMLASGDGLKNLHLSSFTTKG
ncbi:MAG: hypothetical protein HRT61_01425 [Ekhidna sp.]|nr:hypothetical protein [Ekhidna sp.]